MNTKEVSDPRLKKALSRYEVVGRYLSLGPRRGLKKKLLEQLSKQTWIGPDGEPFVVSAETIRAWARRYRRSGLEGLMDKERPQRGTRALTEQQCGLICTLKKEVPERSIDRIIQIAQDMGMVEADVLKRSTVHRVLAAQNLSARKLKTPDNQDLDRFEADYPNALWQSDMLQGPWLPDPGHPGKVRRTYLYAFLDDHSRLLLYGRFSFKENLPHLELVFRRALQRFGKVIRCYYDNGQVYRSGHMKQIMAAIGCCGVIFTKPRRPEGHGKIEAFNQYVRSAFIAELKVSQITTLDELNEAFIAWADLQYNQKIHSETGQRPIDRWRAGVDNVEYVEEEKLRQAFLWKEHRTTDKTGTFSLLGTRYQMGPGHYRKKIEVRFDPEALHEIEVWQKGQFIQRVKPLNITAHRRKKTTTQPDEQTPAQPTADWLGHLVEKRRNQGFVEPDPRQFVNDAKEKRARADLALLDVLVDKLDSGVVDHGAVTDYLDRFGPFDPELAEIVLDQLFEQGERKDLHTGFYLDAIRAAAKGDFL